MNKRDRMYNQIAKHGADLNKIFSTTFDDVTLAKRLHSLEIKAHRLSTDYCNGDNGVNTESWENLSYSILTKVNKILKFREKKIRIFLNGDARGYALKIDDEFVQNYKGQIHKDWGGYGILAPEFNGN
jgi:hypothetical protein